MFRGTLAVYTDSYAKHIGGIFDYIQDDKKVSVHLMITVKKKQGRNI
jgi:hypothetical protein